MLEKIKKSSIIISFLSVLFLYSFHSVGYAEPATPSFIDQILLEKENAVALQSIPKGNLYIPKGTAFVVALNEPLSSKKSKKGDQVDLLMVDNLIVNGVVVIPKGAIGRAVVTDAKKNGFFGRGGKLIVKSESIQTLNGISVPLDSILQKNGKNDNGAVAVAAAVTLVGGFFMKGTNVYYDTGTEFTVVVSDNMYKTIVVEVSTTKTHTTYVKRVK